MSFLGSRNAVSIGVSPHVTMGGPNLLNKLSPSLLLNFAGAETLDPRITFTRATTATFTGSNGLIQTAAIDAPRFDYNPATLAPLGLLIEEQRTNLLTYSEQFDDAAWTKTRSSITADATTSPDGTVDADKLVEDTDTSTHIVSSQGVSFTSGTTYSFSVWAKRSGRDFRATLPATVMTAVSFRFNLQSGTATISGGAGTETIKIESAGNNWYRCSGTFTATSTVTASLNFGLLLGEATNPNAGSYTGDGVSGIFIWGAQLEAGAFPTSYIPTVASQVTRSADTATMTGTNFSSWYNATEGTLYGQADWLGPSSFDYFFSLNNGTTSNLISLGATSTALTRFIVSNAGVTQASVSGPAGSANSVFKVAGAYQVNSFAAATNGLLGTVDTSGTVPSVDQASLTSSQGSANLFNGHIRQLAYYPRRLANSELQAITA